MPHMVKKNFLLHKNYFSMRSYPHVCGQCIMGVIIMCLSLFYVSQFVSFMISFLKIYHFVYGLVEHLQYHNIKMKCPCHLL